MVNGDKPSSGGGNAPRPEAEEQPFDRWLRKQLHAMFDPVVNEPLPPELLKAIDDDAERARQEGLAAGSKGAEDGRPSETKRSS
jgi:hypothetical protein